MIDHSLAYPDRARLNMRLDADLYLFRLQAGHVSMTHLRAIMRRMGLQPVRSRRAMYDAIYQDMKE